MPRQQVVSSNQDGSLIPKKREFKGTMETKDKGKPRAAQTVDDYDIAVVLSHFVGDKRTWLIMMLNLCKQVLAGTTDASTCPFSTFKHF